MAANFLRSPAAIDMSVHVVRAFVRVRQALATRAELVEGAPASKALEADIFAFARQHLTAAGRPEV